MSKPQDNSDKLLSKGIKASVFFIICGVLKDAVDFLVTPVFSRILEQEEYGLFNVYNSWFQIFRILMSLYIFSDGYIVGLSRYEDKKEKFTSSQLGLVTTLLIPWLAVYWINHNTWNDLLQMSTSMVMLMFAHIGFTNAFNLWQAKKRFTYDYRSYVPVMVTYILLQPTIPIILILNNHTDINNGLVRIYAGVGVQILFGIIFFVLQFVKKPVFFDKEYWKYGVSANAVLLPHYLSQILLNHSDRIMIDRFVGKAKTAIYSIAHSAAFTMLVVTTSINSVFTPWLYSKLKKKDTSEIRKLTSTMLILVAVVSLMIVIVTPELMMVLGDRGYTEGIWIIPPLIFGVFIMFIYTLFADIELFFKGNRYVTYSAVIGAVINIVLNYIMIPVYGYLVAAYTTVAGYAVMCICHFLFMSLICKRESLSVSPFFDIRIMIITTVILAASIAGAMCLYKFTVIRYIILAGIMILLFIKRKLLIESLISMKKSVDKSKGEQT